MMNIRNKVTFAITGLALATVSYSFVTPEVQAAPAKQGDSLQEDSASAFPTLAMIMVLQHEYVLDPTGLINPTRPYVLVASSESQLSEAELLDSQAMQLLD